MIRKIRLIVLVLMLLGSISMFTSPTTQTVSAFCEGGGGEGCGPGPGGPDGCKCCSDAQCDSNYCDPKTEKCAKKPTEEND